MNRLSSLDMRAAELQPPAGDLPFVPNVSSVRERSDRSRADGWEKLSRQLDPKEGHMSDQSNVANSDVTTPDAPTTTPEGTEPVNTEMAEAAVEVTTAPEVETPEVEAPSVTDLLLRDHKERVLGKDKISTKQMTSYLKFFGSDPESGDELASPLEHPFITDVLGEYDTETWARIARQGKSALGEKAKEVDEKYIDMWDEFFGTHQGRGNAAVPHSHMWLKGAVAAALLIAEHIGEADEAMREAIAKAKVAGVVSPTEAALAATPTSTEDVELTDEEKADLAAEGEEPPTEQDEPAPADYDTRDQEGREDEEEDDTDQ